MIGALCGRKWGAKRKGSAVHAFVGALARRGAEKSENAPARVGFLGQWQVSCGGSLLLANWIAWRDGGPCDFDPQFFGRCYCR
jgi:hypothetical protein